MRRWIRKFFDFSRGEANGFLILLPLSALFIFSEPLFRWWQSTRTQDFTSEQVWLDSLMAFWIDTEVNTIPEDDEVPINRFNFNPNVATEEELLALGFSPGLAKRLINYRNKGGRFNRPDDLMRLYGMDSSFYRSIASWVVLPQRDVESEKQPAEFRSNSVPKTFTRFNLNHADTSLLKTVRGIGPKLSSRIVTYRNALGGFVSPNQLNEIFGLDSAVVNRLVQVSFIEDDFYPRRLNINDATEQELAVHPYISARMALAVVTYRFQHGNYRSVDDLRKILQFDENQLDKLRPYLSVDE